MAKKSVNLRKLWPWQKGKIMNSLGMYSVGPLVLDETGPARSKEEIADVVRDLFPDTVQKDTDDIFRCVNNMKFPCLGRDKVALQIYNTFEGTKYGLRKYSVGR